MKYEEIMKKHDAVEKHLQAAFRGTAAIIIADVEVPSGYALNQCLKALLDALAHHRLSRDQFARINNAQNDRIARFPTTSKTLSPEGTR